MSVDPRCGGRPEQRRRQPPTPVQAPTPQAQTKPQRQHRVEIEEDPEELFRQLMQVSPDGTVPEHLMARLRQLEAQRKRAPQGANAKRTSANKGTSSDPNQDDSLYSELAQMLLEEDDA